MVKKQFYIARILKRIEMKYIKILILLLIFSITISSQNIYNYNTIYDLKYYKSYYSKYIQTSSFVIYKLYKGGGNVSRSNMSFVSYKRLPHFNYTKSGYDRGHLVAAEDLAQNKSKLKSTFYYINCVPQTVKLNRGIWKTYETEIRKLSQRDSLIIVCGGCDYTSNNILVPRCCFKVVYNLKTKKCIYSLYFKNDNSGYVEVNDKLKRKFTFKKIIELYNK